MLNLFALLLITVFLVAWMIMVAWDYEFKTPYYLNSINRLELHILKINMITRLVAVGSVAFTCMVLAVAAYFVDIAYSRYVFNPIKLPYTDLINLSLLFIAMFIFATNSIYHKALNQIVYQKANPSLSIVKRAKKFNVLFNMGIILFALCLDIQLFYRAFNINI